MVDEEQCYYTFSIPWRRKIWFTFSRSGKRTPDVVSVIPTEVSVGRESEDLPPFQSKRSRVPNPDDYPTPVFTTPLFRSGELPTMF